MSSTFWRLSKLHLAALSFTALSLRTPPYFTALMIIRLVLFFIFNGRKCSKSTSVRPGTGAAEPCRGRHLPFGVYLIIWAWFLSDAMCFQRIINDWRSSLDYLFRSDLVWSVSDFQVQNQNGPYNIRVHLISTSPSKRVRNPKVSTWTLLKILLFTHASVPCTRRNQVLNWYWVYWGTDSWGPVAPGLPDWHNFNFSILVNK